MTSPTHNAVTASPTLPPVYNSLASGKTVDLIFDS